MTRRIRLAAFPLAALALLLSAACTDPVDRVGDAAGKLGDPPTAAELNARVQSWRDGLEFAATAFRTTYFAQDGSVESLTLGEFHIHLRDRWLWLSRDHEQNPAGTLPSDDPSHLAMMDGRVWQSFDPDDGWFAPDGGDNEVGDEGWELFLAWYAGYIFVEPFPDDADVTAAELDGRAVWAVEYTQVEPGGTASGSGSDGDYQIDLRRDDLVTVLVDPASGAPLRRITASRQWDGDEDRAKFRSNWSIQLDLASWNSDPAKPVIAPVLTEDEARRIALPNRYREPDERRPPQAADGDYWADQAAFSLDELRTALVRWVGRLDTLRTSVERREFGSDGELTSGADLEITVNFRERWSHVESIQIGSDGEPVPASRQQSLGTPEGPLGSVRSRTRLARGAADTRAGDRSAKPSSKRSASISTSSAPSTAARHSWTTAAVMFRSSCRRTRTRARPAPAPRPMNPHGIPLRRHDPSLLRPRNGSAGSRRYLPASNGMWKTAPARAMPAP